MVHILQNYSFADDRMTSMFADRKRLFVDLLRWDVPVVDGQYEVDCFDGGSAVYLIAVDEDGTHAGSMRLLPTAEPHILDSLFHGLCDGPVPTGEHVMEITRLCLPCRLGASRRLAIRNRLISAMVDHALAAGVRTLTGVVAWAFLEQVMAMGWRCSALGKPRDHEGTRLGAFRIDLDIRTTDQLAATGIYAPGAIRVPLAAAA